MKYAIIGTGAIGGYYGGRLAHARHEVHFLAHSDYDAMSQALTIDSCDGSFVIDHPSVYRLTEEMPPVDVVIVALKTTNNYLLPKLLRPLLDNDPTVVLIQNGLYVEQDLAKAIPGIKLIAGLAFICSTKVGPAHVAHQDYGSLTLANYNCLDDRTLQAIAADFRSAGINTDIVEYHFGRWRKAIWNLPFNGLTVTHKTDTITLLRDPESARLVRSIMEEVVAIANALGVNQLGHAQIDANLASTLRMKPYAPSMKVDYDHHRPMEIHYLYTRAIEEADRLGVAVPHLRDLQRRLLAIQHSIV